MRAGLRLYRDERVDRFEPRGIAASGRALCDAYRDLHWGACQAREGNTSMYVEMALDNLLDPDGNILPIAWLDHGPPSRMNWHPRASGISIPYDVAAELEKGWARITGTG